VLKEHLGADWKGELTARISVWVVLSHANKPNARDDIPSFADGLSPTREFAIFAAS
jgi:hypothetical protein